MKIQIVTEDTDCFDRHSVNKLTELLSHSKIEIEECKNINCDHLFPLYKCYIWDSSIEFIYLMIIDLASKGIKPNRVIVRFKDRSNPVIEIPHFEDKDI